MSRPPAKRRKLTPSEMSNVWKKYYGNMFDVKCYVCRKRSITPFAKHDGHIIAHSMGGPTDESNIIPICSECNSNMLTRNLYEYQRNTYPTPEQENAKFLLRNHGVEWIYNHYVKRYAKQDIDRTLAGMVTYRCLCNKAVFAIYNHNPFEQNVTIERAEDILVEHLEHICGPICYE